MKLDRTFSSEIKKVANGDGSRDLEERGLAGMGEDKGPRKGGGGMIALCREIDKESGEIAVYSLELKLTDEEILSLKIRARVNQELRYFVTLRCRWEGTLGKEIEKLLKRRKLTDRAIEAFGGLVEL